MRTFLIILMVLVIFLYKPELLRSFDTMSGRILMLLFIVYLARLNALLGFVAALVMIRVLNHDVATVLWTPLVDLMHLEGLMRPRDSSFLPTLRSTTVPVNDIYEPYTLY